jgi:hypothetical protein
VTVAAARAVAAERAAVTGEGARAEGAPEAGTVAEVTAAAARVAAARVAAATVEAKAAARARLRAERTDMAEVNLGAATVERAERAERAVYMAVTVKTEGAPGAVATGGVDRGAAAAVVAKEAPKAVVREEAREEAERVADLASAETEMARVALGGVWGQWQRGRYSHAQTRTCVSRTANERVQTCCTMQRQTIAQLHEYRYASQAIHGQQDGAICRRADRSKSTDCNLARAARGFHAHARSPAAAATRRQTTHCMLSQNAQAWARKSFLRHGEPRAGLNWKCGMKGMLAPKHVA